MVVQVAGARHDHVIKLIPPLCITEADCQWIDRSFDAVIADAHKVPGAVWTLGKTLAGHAMKARAERVKPAGPRQLGRSRTDRLIATELSRIASPSTAG